MPQKRSINRTTERSGLPSDARAASDSAFRSRPALSDNLPPFAMMKSRSARRAAETVPSRAGGVRPPERVGRARLVSGRFGALVFVLAIYRQILPGEPFDGKWRGWPSRLVQRLPLVARPSLQGIGAAGGSSRRRKREPRFGARRGAETGSLVTSRSATGGDEIGGHGVSLPLHHARPRLVGRRLRGARPLGVRYGCAAYGFDAAWVE